MRLFPYKHWLLCGLGALLPPFHVSAWQFHEPQRRLWLKSARGGWIAIVPTGESSFFYFHCDLSEDQAAGISPRELRKEPMQQLFFRGAFIVLERSEYEATGGRVSTGDSPLGIPSGFARRAAGRLGGRRTSPATRSLQFGNLLDFVSAGTRDKMGKNVKLNLTKLLNNNRWQLKWMQSSSYNKRF